LSDIAQSGPDLTHWQAQRVIVAGLLISPGIAEGDSTSFRFSPESLEFDATLFRRKQSQHFAVNLRTLPRVIAKHGFGGVWRLKDEAGKDLPEPLDKLAWSGPDQQSAELVANALNYLRETIAAQDDALREFPQQAAAWRALAAKPPLPEAIRGQRLLAETALTDRKAAQALVHYERGVELDPVWPEGRYNAALVAAELELYDEAVEQMRAYVTLAPDANDAQEARDHIVIWQDKATQKPAESPEDQPRPQPQPHGRLGWGGAATARQ
jgi:tetratricopeptide (TPR) repeat protein